MLALKYLILGVLIYDALVIKFENNFSFNLLYFSLF
jgi:hypothetical protein